MISQPTKRFLHSGFYFVRATWPYALGEVLAAALTPIVKRMVFLIWLLGTFRYLSRHAEPGMSNSEAWGLLWPVFLSVVGVMVLPLVVAYFDKRSTRGRKRKTTGAIRQEYSRILFDKDEVFRNWDRYFEGQKAVMVYITFVLIVSPVFLFYSPKMLIPYLTFTALFGFICTRKPCMSKEYRFGRVFNRFVNSNVYLETTRYAVFCIYIIVCALIIVASPKRLPLEFIFVLIVGMNLQLARGKAVGKFFLQEAEDGLVFDKPVEHATEVKDDEYRKVSANRD